MAEDGSSRSHDAERQKRDGARSLSAFSRNSVSTWAEAEKHSRATRTPHLDPPRAPTQDLRRVGSESRTLGLELFGRASLEEQQGEKIGQAAGGQVAFAASRGRTSGARWQEDRCVSERYLDSRICANTTRRDRSKQRYSEARARNLHHLLTQSRSSNSERRKWPTLHHRPRPGQKDESPRHRRDQAAHPRRAHSLRHRQDFTRPPGSRQDPHIPGRRHHSNK